MHKHKYEKSIYHLFLHTLFTVTAVLLSCCAFVTVLVDPFFHYHKPIAALGLRAVQTDKEYQVPGALRHLDYDAVLAGSSVVENNDNSWFTDAFGVTIVKAVRSYGGVADLCWYVDQAYASGHDMKMVFFNLDPAALVAEPRTTFKEAGVPIYLYNSNPLDDVKYLFNKTVLFEKIPYMIAQSRSGYNENLSYNWAEGKNFSEEGALSQYRRHEGTELMKRQDTYAAQVEGNIALLTELVRSHPQTQFYFFLPPYSALWWDDAIRRGERDAYLWSEQQVMEALLPYENVRLYDFQNEVSVVGDLDYYMDTVHFRPVVNKAMVDAMVGGRDEVAAQTAEEYIAKTYEMSEDLQSTLIARLAAEGRFLYE